METHVLPLILGLEELKKVESLGMKTYKQLILIIDVQTWSQFMHLLSLSNEHELEL